MSLLKEALTECEFVIPTKQPDGYGGWETVFTPGASFEAAIVRNQSLQALVAEKQGVTEVYTISTSKALTLEFHDILRRKSDGKVFRVTSDGTESHTPASASLDMRTVTAEAYALPVR